MNEAEPRAEVFPGRAWEQVQSHFAPGQRPVTSPPSYCAGTNLPRAYSAPRYADSCRMLLDTAC